MAATISNYPAAGLWKILRMYYHLHQALANSVGIWSPTESNSRMKTKYKIGFLHLAKGKVLALLIHPLWSGLVFLDWCQPPDIAQSLQPLELPQLGEIVFVDDDDF